MPLDVLINLWQDAHEVLPHGQTQVQALLRRLMQAVLENVFSQAHCIEVLFVEANSKHLVGCELKVIRNEERIPHRRCHGLL